MKLIEEERKRITAELDNYQNQLSLLDYNCSNLDEMIQAIHHKKGKIIESDMNKLEALKNQADTLQTQTEKLKAVRLNYPNIVFTQNETDKMIQKIGELSISTHMQNKRICFFGDGNKVMEYNLETTTWFKKQIQNNNNDFLYYAAAVTLPNGDALIIGGGSSTTVYQYTSQGSLII